MNWLVRILSATTLAFAASTLYYVHMLQQASVRHVPAPAPASTPPIRTPVKPLTPAAPPKAADNAVSSPARDPGKIAVARHRLDELRDPAARTEQGQLIAYRLREDWQSVASHIGLSSAELERVIAELTEQELQFQQHDAECQLDPRCDDEALDIAHMKSADDRTAAILGPETYARFKPYQESSEERSMLGYLNRQLPSANTLSDATSSKLARALSEQRQQFVRDAEARGEQVAGDGSFFTLRSAAIAGAADEQPRRRESATDYVRREVQIASGILNREQLASFKEMFENELYFYKDRLRDLEVAQTARAAAGDP